MSSSAGHRQWHLHGWPAYVLAPFALVVAMLVQLVIRVFGIKGSISLTAEEVAAYLDDFIEGRSADWDWDDFTSIPLDDPSLEAIRQEAAMVALPVDEIGDATLRELLKRARSLQPFDL